MTTNRIYAGISAFFANRSGNHYWLDNNARPFLSLIRTKKTGKKVYTDLFLDTNTVKVTVSAKGEVTLKFPADVAKPIFSVLEKD